MVHGKLESRRTIAGWTKLSAVLYRRDWPRDVCRQELPGVRVDALSKFFREQQFARLAVTMSKSAVLPTGKTPLEIITGSMMNRYTDLLRRVSPEPNGWHSCMRLQIGWMTLSNNILVGRSPRSTAK